jgi:protein dithiol oxidoreductase (disulfide-forming)
MNRTRRLVLAALAAASLAAGTAHAQLYTLLQPPQPMDGSGKVEVIEFFSYACPHCFKLAPFMVSWAKKQGADVVVKRVPGAGSDSWTQLAVLYYSLEAMGKLEEMHMKAFNAMHTDGVNLASPKIRESWLAKNGVDPAQYQAVEKSFSVQSKVGRAKQLMASYKVDGVPMVVVNGKYVTSNASAGGPDRVVDVVDQLVALARKDLGLPDPNASKAAAAPAKAPATPVAPVKK